MRRSEGLRIASNPTALRLTIGEKTKTDLLAALQRRGVRLNRFAEALFDDERFRTSPRAQAVEVRFITVASLGLDNGGTYTEVVRLAAEHGLAECPLELGPHLRLAWLDQPEGSIGHPASKHCAPPGAVTVASPFISQDDDVPKGFYLRVIEGVPWLRGYVSWDGHVCASTDVFAFMSDASAGSPPRSP